MASIFIRREKESLIEQIGVKSLLYLIIFVIIFTGCSDRSKKYNYINYKKLIKSNKIEKLNSSIFNNSDIYAPVSITIINNYLLCIDHKAEKIIKIFSLKSTKLLKSFGRLGQGPNEFIGASEIIPDPKDKNVFWIFDVTTRKLKKYNIIEILNDKFEPEKIIEIINGNGAPFHLLITTDEKIIGVGAFFKGRISIYNMNGDFIRSIGKIPVILKKERFGPQHSHGFIGKFIFKEKSKEIFIATRYGAIIEKYNIENEKLVSTYYGPDLFFPEYKIVPVGDYHTMTYNKKTRFGYLDICYCKNLDRLFLLYSGKYQYNKENKEPNSSNIIYVLDNNGIIIEQIELDKEVYQMTISDDGSTIFGVTESEILKFNYNEKTNLGI